MAKVSKDAYYFPHFYNARHDRKIKRIRKDLGIEGYGIFFMLLEVLREQTDFKYPYSDIDLLADEFGTSKAKIESVINCYDLFSTDEKEMFFSTKLMCYLLPYLEKSERARVAAQKRWNNFKALPNANAYANALDLDSKCNANQNASKVEVVKESKVNKSKVEVVNQTNENITTTATNLFTPEKVYQENIGLLTPHISQRITALIEDGINPDLISRYIEVAVERNKRNWSYIETIALGNFENNVTTLEQYESMCLERKNSKSSNDKDKYTEVE